MISSEHQFIEPSSVRSQLERIFLSPEFQNAERMRQFLRYIVEETLAGRPKRLKAYNIALAVFGRDEAFDPQTDSIVRVEASRLRRLLIQYYAIEGQYDPIRIELPKGSYVPKFDKVSVERDDHHQHAEPNTRQSYPEAELPSGPTIAVLPFVNMSGDPGQEYFSDGITEEIITQLTHFKNLFVLAHNTTFQYKGITSDVNLVVRELGVEYVLGGSVRKAGDKIRLTVQLLDSKTGVHVWADSYTRDLTSADIFAIQDDITEQVVTAIAEPYGVISQVNRRKAQRKPAARLTSYEWVLRFYVYWASYSDYAPTCAGLEQAVKDDPHYSDAWAALAFLYIDEYRFGRGLGLKVAEDVLDRALDAVRRAVETEPNSVMAYQAKFCTHYHRRELNEFKSASERALQLNPNHADMLADLGVALWCLGEHERGLALTNKAIKLSPIHPGWYHCPRAAEFFRKGDYEQALAEAKAIIMPQWYWSHVYIGFVCGVLGRKQEGQAAIKHLLELYPDFSRYARQEFRTWNIAEDLIDRFIDGLRKAGLDIPT